MHHRLLAAALALLAAPALAQETRHLGAHEHGVGRLNIAFEGDTVSMEIDAPGADIAGFEHAAETSEDRAALDAAIAKLGVPQDLFGWPAEAGCTAATATAEMVAEEDHDGDGDGKHHHEDDAEASGGDHEGEAGGHTEFHAAFTYTCIAPQKAVRLALPYFDTFPNARKLVVQIISGVGTAGLEADRDTPEIDLSGRI